MTWIKDNNRSAIVRRLLLLLVTILLIFAVINAVWFFGYQQKYNRFAEKLNVSYIDGVEERDMLRYSKEIGDCTITMKMPTYLGSGGFLSVAKSEGYTVQLDEDGNIVGGSEMYVTLFVWPKYFSGYKIGVDFYDEVNSVWEQVELTADLSLVNTDTLDDEYTNYINQLISTHKPEILKLIDLVEQNLGIDIT